MFAQITTRLTWVFLSRIRNSFLSRALVTLSISSLILSNIPELIVLSGIDLFSIRLLLFGSLCFLFGYVLFGIWCPSEFSQPGEIHDHVSRMCALADQNFAASRSKLSQRLIDRIETLSHLQAPEPVVALLKRKLQNCSSKESLSADDIRGLFHADLTLRQFDKPLHRIATATVLAIGIACLVIPTALNVFKATF